MVMVKKVFTTGQVARICKVAPRVVAKWFDAGRLHGYRVPGSQDRRIPRDHLIRFLKEHGMPLGELEGEELFKVLVVGAEAEVCDRLRELLPEADDYRCEPADCGFHAGLIAETFAPAAVVVDLAVGRREAVQLAAHVRRHPRYCRALLVALADADEPDAGPLADFDEVFLKPFDAALLAERLQAAAEDRGELL
jgi:CheY-like chemotaxis protein